VGAAFLVVATLRRLVVGFFSHLSCCGGPYGCNLLGGNVGVVTFDGRVCGALFLGPLWLFTSATLRVSRRPAHVSACRPNKRGSTPPFGKVNPQNSLRLRRMFCLRSRVCSCSAIKEGRFSDWHTSYWTDDNYYWSCVACLLSPVPRPTVL